MSLYVGTGSEAKRAGGFTSETTVATVTTALGTSSSVTQMTATGGSTVPTNSTQGELQFSFTPTGTASTNDYVEIDEVQVEIAPASTAFERRPFGAELLLCQRFYQKSFDYGTAPAQNSTPTKSMAIAQVVGAAAAQSTPFVIYPVRMRTAGTVTFYNPTAANAFARNSTRTADCSATATHNNSESGFAIDITTAAGSAAGDFNHVHWQSDGDI